MRTEEIDRLPAEIRKVGKEAVYSKCFDQRAMGFLERPGPSGLGFSPHRVGMDLESQAMGCFDQAGACDRTGCIALRQGFQ